MADLNKVKHIMEVHDVLRRKVQEMAKAKVIEELTKARVKNPEFVARYGTMSAFWLEDDEIVVAIDYHGSYSGSERITIPVSEIENF